jgi:hypothetical protein
MIMWRKIALCALAAIVVAPFAGMRPASALTVSPVVLEYDLEPGDAVVGSIRLTNEGETAETYYASAQDFVAGDEAGSPSFIGMSATRSLVDWLSFQTSRVTLGPGESAYITYNLAVPAQASPGGYFAGLLFSTESPHFAGQGVGVSAATGTILLVRVAGEVVEKGAVTDFSASPASSTSLPVDFNVRFENQGTVHVKPSGVIRVTNMWGGTSAVITVNEDGGNVLPDSARVFGASWSKAELPENASELVKEWKNFGFGPYTATLILNYGESNQVVSASTSFWVMPWMLVVLFIILLVILALLVMQYNKWIVAQAMSKRR